MQPTLPIYEFLQDLTARLPLSSKLAWPGAFKFHIKGHIGKLTNLRGWKKSLVNVRFTPHRGCQNDHRELIMTVVEMYPKVLKELTTVIRRLPCPSSALQSCGGWRSQRLAKALYPSSKRGNNGNPGKIRSFSHTAVPSHNSTTCFRQATLICTWIQIHVTQMHRNT